MLRTLLLCGMVLVIATSTMPVMAQEPTPTPPWPTPIATGEYVIYQTMTYGEGGVMLALLFVGGIILLDLIFRVAQRVMTG